MATTPPLPRTLRLWQTSVVLEAWASVTTNDSGFPWVQVVTVVIVFAIFYPLQRVLRQRISERRRERYLAEQSDQRPTEADPPPEGTDER